MPLLFGQIESLVFARSGKLDLRPRRSQAAGPPSSSAALAVVQAPDPSRPASSTGAAQLHPRIGLNPRRPKSRCPACVDEGSPESPWTRHVDPRWVDAIRAEWRRLMGNAVAEARLSPQLLVYRESEIERSAVYGLYPSARRMHLVPEIQDCSQSRSWLCSGRRYDKYRGKSLCQNGGGMVEVFELAL